MSFYCAVPMSLLGGVEEIARRIHPHMAKELQKRGQTIANSVGFIQVTDTAGGGRTGSCVLLTPNLLVTCRHVIRDINEARSAKVAIYIAETEGGTPVATTLRLQPDVLFLSSAQEDVSRMRGDQPSINFLVVALDFPSNIPACLGLESRMSISTWQTGKTITNVQVVAVHPGRKRVEVYPPGRLLNMGVTKQGDWQFPIRYSANTAASYSGGAVLTLALDLLGIHCGYVEGQYRFGVPIQAVLHCAAAVWEQQQRKRGRGVQQVEGPAQEDFLRLVKAQGITMGDISPSYLDIVRDEVIVEDPPAHWADTRCVILDSARISSPVDSADSEDCNEVRPALVVLPAGPERRSRSNRFSTFASACLGCLGRGEKTTTRYRPPPQEQYLFVYQ